MELTIRCLLALLPLAVVLVLMIRWGWGAHQAGPAGWIACLTLAILGFGLTIPAFWVSQAKGLLLSVFVLAVMWPALALYHWMDQTGGIGAIARQFERGIPNRGMRLILLAWALSAVLEGMAGFGIPIAVVAPMLTRLGVQPVTAVAAVAVGHAWAVTFGDTGVILQTLAAVVGLETAQIVPWAALLLGLVCWLCGLATSQILGVRGEWRTVSALALVMSAAQYGLAKVGLLALSALGGGLSGLFAYLAGVKARSVIHQAPAGPTAQREPEGEELPDSRPAVSGRGDSNRTWSEQGNPLLLTIATYGALTMLMATVALLPSAREWVAAISWKPSFPAVHSGSFVTPAGPGQVFRPFGHPGFLILVVTVFSLLFGSRVWFLAAARRTAVATWRSAAKPTVGILFMVGLSTLMEHSGMSRLLAEGLSQVLGAAYPLLSPCIGILGAFATGSNNNSNVLFGPLQRDVAVQLHHPPEILAAAQTARGSLGSMLAPAKIVVGCSTVGVVGQEGPVARRTVPLGLGFGLLAGIAVLILCWLR